MAAPTYSAGTYGGIINALSVAHGGNCAAVADLSTKLDGAILCKILAGASAITTAHVAAASPTVYPSGTLDGSGSVAAIPDPVLPGRTSFRYPRSWRSELTSTRSARRIDWRALATGRPDEV